MAEQMLESHDETWPVPRRHWPHPSRQSLRGLDWFIFCLADIQVGFGPFIAVYLTAEKWPQADIGFILSIGGLVALAGQIPGGALVNSGLPRARTRRRCGNCYSRERPGTCRIPTIHCRACCRRNACCWQLHLGTVDCGD